MPQFEHTFTGKDTGVEIKPLDRLARSQERAMDLLTKGEELKRKTFKENEDWFLKEAKVTPETYISQKNTEMQAKLLETYNNQATQILKKAGSVGNLSLEDKLALQKGRQELESFQAKMNSDLERFKLDEKIINNDAGKEYDIEEWYKKDAKGYYDSGTYSDAPLPIKEKPFESWLGTISKGYTGKVNTDVESTNEQGITLKRSTWTNMALPQAQELIKQGILTQRGERKNVTNRFGALSEAEKMKWLDTNKDGKLDQAERTDENGIIAWAQQHQPFISAVMREDSGASSNLFPSASKKSFDWNGAVGTGHNRNNEFPVRGAVDIDTDEGKVTLPNSLDFSGIPRTTTDARKINKILVPDGKGGYTEKSLGESASFDIVSYSPQDDVLVIKLKSNTSDRTYRDGVNLIVRGSEFDDLLKRKPFGIDRSTFTENKASTATSQVTKNKGALDNL